MSRLEKAREMMEVADALRRDAGARGRASLPASGSLASSSTTPGGSSPRRCRRITQSSTLRQPRRRLSPYLQGFYTVKFTCAGQRGLSCLVVREVAPCVSFE